MGHFKDFELWKVGHFEEKSRDQFQNEKGTEHECVRFFDISNKNANVT